VMGIAAAQGGKLRRKAGILEFAGKLRRNCPAVARENVRCEAQELHRPRKVALTDEQLHLLVAEVMMLHREHVLGPVDPLDVLQQEMGRDLAKELDRPRSGEAARDHAEMKSDIHTDQIVSSEEQRLDGVE